MLGKITVQSSEALSIALAAIRADLEVTKARIYYDQHRNDQNSQSLELNYEQLLAERMDQKAALDQTLFEVRFLESDLVRTQETRSDEYIKRMCAQLKEREELIGRLDKALELMKPTGPAGNDAGALKSIEAAIKAQAAQLEEASVLTLISPIDGVVTKVLRNNGDGSWSIVWFSASSRIAWSAAPISERVRQGGTGKSPSRSESLRRKGKSCGCQYDRLAKLDSSCCEHRKQTNLQTQRLPNCKQISNYYFCCRVILTGIECKLLAIEWHLSEVRISGRQLEKPLRCNSLR